MLATQTLVDHFNPAPHGHRTHLAADTITTTEILVEADHVAPKLNEDDSFVQDLLRDGVSWSPGPSLVTSWMVIDPYLAINSFHARKYAIARNVVSPEKAALYV
jgi:hypothetical protein